MRTHVGAANVFCGDTLFNPDVGTARCDFPGGDAATLYASARRLLALPGHYRIYTGHDYPPGGGREPLASAAVADQARDNRHLGREVSEADYVALRTTRDASLIPPRLIHQSLQFNVRAGQLPAPQDPAGDRFLHVPLRLEGLSW